LILGTDHAEIGARILSQWSFPDDVVSAIKYHHDPEAVNDSMMQIDVVHLANLLCQTNSTAPDSTGHTVELSAAVIERLGVEIDQFEMISEKIAQWVDELADAMTFN
jgi:HD-like signal output (HDOD) protein